jgi:hypothetical protein
MRIKQLQPLLALLVAVACMALVPSVALAASPADQEVSMDDMLRQHDGEHENVASTEEESQAQRDDVDEYEREYERERRSDGDRADEPAPRTTNSTNWAAIVGQNALWGGITGGLIGLGAWLVTGRDFSPWVIAQFAGGGLLVGATIGVISLAIHSDRYANQMNTIDTPDPGPTPVKSEGPIININGRF